MTPRRRATRTNPRYPGDEGGAPRALEEPLLTANEVASFLNVSKITIYEWAQKGKIPAFRIGHHWRFRRQEIEAWLDSNRQGRSADGSAANGES
jgi:excisionase family DNA binding protein